MRGVLSSAPASGLKLLVTLVERQPAPGPVERSAQALREGDFGDEGLVVRALQTDFDVAQRMRHPTLDPLERSQGRRDPDGPPTGRVRPNAEHGGEQAVVRVRAPGV